MRMLVRMHYILGLSRRHWQSCMTMQTASRACKMFCFAARACLAVTALQVGPGPGLPTEGPQPCHCGGGRHAVQPRLPALLCGDCSATGGGPQPVVHLHLE